jgi:seryl-tRNA synthetase
MILKSHSAAQEKWLDRSAFLTLRRQANRLKLRFRNGNNGTELAHTLNGSALKLYTRILASIRKYQMENYIKSIRH